MVIRNEGDIGLNQPGFGWAGSLSEFLATEPDALLQSLAAHHLVTTGQSPSRHSRQAWIEMHAVLVDALTQVSQRAVTPDAWSVAFEYELPMEGGRRPDAIVFAGSVIVVLEFKSATRPTQADLDQVAAYARDLAEYHEASHGRRVVPVLVLPRTQERSNGESSPLCVGPSALADALLSQHQQGRIDLAEWLQADYRPLPTLVAAAKRLFQHEPLPHVRRAIAIGIPETVDAIIQLAEEARRDEKKVLLLLTGVPGSGKTLVGLRVIYEGSADGQATFLSGNGPLVAVLQDALKSRVFVRDLHKFIKTYGLSAKVPPMRIIAFDEAQRAWDRRYMTAKRGIDASEPDLLITAAARIPDWVLLIGLVGEGQEIYTGEEGGLGQWRDALTTHGGPGWEVRCPPNLAAHFDGLAVHEDSRLDLNVSLRSRTAEQMHEWVRRLLEGSLPLAARLATHFATTDFPIWITRDLEEARSYARRRYDNEPEKVFGLLMSSHSKMDKKLGLDIGFMRMQRLKVERWFNAPREDLESACALREPITEFQCQGLELDLPIVVWGNDMLWSGERWEKQPKRRKHPVLDPYQLLTNAYRVLLTRGRDGLVIVVPDFRELDQTEVALLAAGVKPLPSDHVAIAAEEAVAPLHGENGA